MKVPTTTDLANTRPAKKTKPAAFAALNRMLEDMQNGAEPNALDLATLYHHFLPARPRKPRTPWEWVCAALPGKDEHRHALHYVHVTDAYAEATDGHRVHRVPLEMLQDPPEPGLYHAIGEPCTDTTLQFPNVDRVIPDGGAAGGDVIIPDRVEPSDSTSKDVPSMFRRFRLPAGAPSPDAPRKKLDGIGPASPGDTILGATVNDRYHEAVRAGCDEFRVQQTASGSPLLYTFPSGAVAVVMPLNRE